MLADICTLEANGQMKKNKQKARFIQIKCRKFDDES